MGSRNGRRRHVGALAPGFGHVTWLVADHCPRGENPQTAFGGAFDIANRKKSSASQHLRILTSLHQICSSSFMRTTLNIDDEILEAAKLIAGERNLSVGAALSELARRGLQPSGPVGRKRGEFPVFEVSRGGTVLTLGRVKRHEDEL